MSKHRIIFHYPGGFHHVLDSGEKKRPQRMRQAFSDLGYLVEEVTGSTGDRMRTVKGLRRHLGEFLFLYSENSALPLRLTGPRHLPTWPSPDISLFKAAYSAGLPIGVYYRDIYWRFPSFAQDVGRLKLAVAIPFYHEELRLYARTAKRVFVQSAEFACQVPTVPHSQLQSLPPGGDWTGPVDRPPPPPLRLLYVGSVCPPIYDIRHVIEAMAKLVQLPVHLDIVTRPSDWAKCVDLYPPLPANTHLHHVTGEDLHPLLRKAHISIQNFAEDPYRALVQPLKLYEAISFGLPILTGTGTSTARFVTENRIGWSVSPRDFVDGVKHLVENDGKLSDCQSQLAKIRSQHTWRARAEEVVKTLTVNPGRIGDSPS